MRGRIYSDQKCDMCGRKFVQDDKRRGLFCPIHSNQQATKRFTVKFGRKVQKRFNNYPEAERFLDTLRYEVDQGTFDYREYVANSPLSFKSLSAEYLRKRKSSISDSTYKLYRRYLEVADDYFGNTSIKKIKYAQIEDFAETLDVSDKTRSNYIDCLGTFFKWLVRRQVISRNEMPDIPNISFELSFRNTIDKETQLEIIDEVKTISAHISPKVWLGIKWLATYISIRPNELRDLKEGDIDIKQGLLIITHPKEKRPKIIPLIKEDIEIIKQMPRGMPDLYFFRHSKGVSGIKAGERFGKNMFYRWWKKACNNLGIDSVDLYGGTMHSSTVSLRRHKTPEQIKRATMRATNKAFERYFQISRDELEDIYSISSCTTSVTPKNKTKTN